MELSNLHNKSVAILGFGLEGRAVASYMCLKGINPVIFEAKPDDEWDEKQKQLINTLGLEVRSGEGYLEGLKEFEVIVRSPGFWRLHPSLLAAEQNGSTITSQTRIFFENCPASIIGVTGTKGKGTTCSLIYSMLNASKSAGEIMEQGEIYLTGNIGKIQPLDFLDSLHNSDVVVYELSSFQLQDLNASPDIGVCLMVTSDHLNHHQNLEEYHQAKSAICRFQKPNQTTIYNSDYPATAEIGKQGDGKKFVVSKNSLESNGALIQEDIIIIEGLGSETIKIDCFGRNLRGSHNLENIAAASLAAMLKGVKAQTAEKCAKEFTGLEHRLQLAGKVNGVSYYNDSISTVPDTTIAAVNSFTEPTILILGGSDKGSSYEPLVEFLCGQKQIKAIALMGQTGKTIGELLKEMNFDKTLIEHKPSFKETLQAITEIATEGDVVILSPASASFDGFKSYTDRGEQFVNYVNSIKPA